MPFTLKKSRSLRSVRDFLWIALTGSGGWYGQLHLMAYFPDLLRIVFVPEQERE